MSLILEDLRHLMNTIGYVLGLDAVEVLLWAVVIVWLWAMRAYLRTVLP